MNNLDYKEDLVRRLKKNDRKAQYTFYHSYSDAMYNICLRILNNEWDAQDVLQKSFVDAFQNIHRYNYTATLGAWLKRITINNCINLLRKKKLTVVAMEDFHHPVEQFELNTEEINMDVINEGISRLPEGYRVVLNLYLLEGYDHREISEILEISESTSKSQYSRARQKLKDYLEKNKYKLYK